MKNYLRLVVLFFGVFFSGLSNSVIYNGIDYNFYISGTSPTLLYTNLHSLCVNAFGSVDYVKYGYQSSNPIGTPPSSVTCLRQQIKPYSSYVESRDFYLVAVATVPTCTASQYLNTTTNQCFNYPVCVGGQTLNTTTKQCDDPVCTTAQYLDTTTHVCTNNPECVGGQTLNTVTHFCENPVCIAPDYLDTVTYTCESNPTCLGGQTLNYSTHNCDTPQCAIDEYLTSDAFCQKISATCDINNPYDVVSNSCQPLVCEGGLQIQNGQCVVPVCPADMVYSPVAKRCAYAVGVYAYDYIDGVSYQRIDYPTGAYRFRFSIPALPGEQIAQTTAVGSPVPSGKMGVEKIGNDFYYSAIATVPAFGKTLDFRVKSRISRDSLAEKLTYLVALSGNGVLTTASIPNYYSLDVLYSLGYSVDRILDFFVDSANAANASGGTRSAVKQAIQDAVKHGSRWCVANPLKCEAVQTFLPDGVKCIYDLMVDGISCFSSEPSPPPEDKPPCTNDESISICPAQGAKASALSRYPLYHASSLSFAAPCDGSSDRYFGIAKYDANGAEINKSCIGPLPCELVPNSNKCVNPDSPMPNSPTGSDGTKPKPPEDVSDDFKKCLDAGCNVSPDDVASLGGDGGGGDNPLKPGKPGDPLSLKKPNEPVDLGKPGDNTAEPLKPKIPLDDKIIPLPDGTIVNTKESVDTSCTDTICDAVPTKETTTTSPGGVTTTDKKTPDMPPVDPTQFDPPPSGGGTTGGGTTPPPISSSGDGDLTQCDKYPDTLGCIKPGDAPEPDVIQTKKIPLDITQPVGSAGACPAPISLGTIFGKQLEFSFKLFCDYAKGIRPVLIAAGWLTAAFIVFM